MGENGDQAFVRLDGQRLSESWEPWGPEEALPGPTCTSLAHCSTATYPHLARCLLPCALADLISGGLSPWHTYLGY